VRTSGIILLTVGAQLLQVPAGGGKPAPALKEVPDGQQISRRFWLVLD
jgi:hypothetical protein